METQTFSILGFNVTLMHTKTSRKTSYDYHLFQLIPSRQVLADNDVTDILSFIEDDYVFNHQLSILFNICIVFKKAYMTSIEGHVMFILNVSSINAAIFTPQNMYEEIRTIDDKIHSDRNNDKKDLFVIRHMCVPQSKPEFKTADINFNNEVVGVYELISRQSDLFISPILKMFNGFILTLYNFKVNSVDSIEEVTQEELLQLCLVNMNIFTTDFLNKEIANAAFNTINNVDYWFMHTVNVLINEYNHNDYGFFVMSVLNKIRNTHIELFNGVVGIFEMTDDWWDFDKDEIADIKIFNELYWLLFNMPDSTKFEDHETVYVFTDPDKKIDCLPLSDIREKFNDDALFELLTEFKLADTYKMLVFTPTQFVEIPKYSNDRIRVLTKKNFKSKFFPKIYFIATSKDVTNDELREYLSNSIILSRYKLRLEIDCVDRNIYRAIKK